MGLACEWNGDPEAHDPRYDACGADAEFEITTLPESCGQGGASCGPHVGAFVGWIATDTNDPETITVRRLDWLSERARLAGNSPAS